MIILTCLCMCKYAICLRYFCQNFTWSFRFRFHFISFSYKYAYIQFHFHSQWNWQPVHSKLLSGYLTSTMEWRAKTSEKKTTIHSRTFIIKPSSFSINSNFTHTNFWWTDGSVFISYFFFCITIIISILIASW